MWIGSAPQTNTFRKYCVLDLFFQIHKVFSVFRLWEFPQAKKSKPRKYVELGLSPHFVNVLNHKTYW